MAPRRGAGSARQRDALQDRVSRGKDHPRGQSSRRGASLEQPRAPGGIFARVGAKSAEAPKLEREAPAQDGSSRGGRGRGRGRGHQASQDQRGRNEPRARRSRRIETDEDHESSSAASESDQPPLDVPASMRPSKRTWKSVPGFDEYHARRDRLREERSIYRARAIAEGKMLDPNKPVDLSQAITMVGECMDMCPELERVTRIVEKDYLRAECDPTTVHGERRDRVPVESRMVKQYRRPAAGEDPQMPCDLRPPVALSMTCEYLLYTLLHEGEPRDVINYVSDRLRAVRTDFSIQQVQDPDDVRIAMDCYERMARFHIYSLHIMATPVPHEGYSRQQDYGQFCNTYTSLRDYYHDFRGIGVTSDCEGEFTAYDVLFELGNPERHDDGHYESIANDNVRNHAQFRTAVRLYQVVTRAIQCTDPLLPTTHAGSSARLYWSQFWNAIYDGDVTYLMACAAEYSFNGIRQMIVQRIFQAFRDDQLNDPKGWTLSELSTVLNIDNHEDARRFFQHYNVRIADNVPDERYLDLSSVPNRVFRQLGAGVPQQTFTSSVETKLGGAKAGDHINGFHRSDEFPARDAAFVDDGEIVDSGTWSPSLRSASPMAFGNGGAPEPTSLFVSDNESETHQPSEGIPKLSNGVGREQSLLKSSLRRTASSAASAKSQAPLPGGSSPFLENTSSASSNGYPAAPSSSATSPSPPMSKSLANQITMLRATRDTLDVSDADNVFCPSSGEAQSAPTATDGANPFAKPASLHLADGGHQGEQPHLSPFAAPFQPSQRTAFHPSSPAPMTWSTQAQGGQGAMQPPAPSMGTTPRFGEPTAKQIPAHSPLAASSSAGGSLFGMQPLQSSSGAVFASQGQKPAPAFGAPTPAVPPLHVTQAQPEWAHSQTSKEASSGICAEPSRPEATEALGSEVALDQDLTQAWKDERAKQLRETIRSARMRHMEQKSVDQQGNTSWEAKLGAEPQQAEQQRQAGDGQDGRRALPTFQFGQTTAAEPVLWAQPPTSTALSQANLDNLSHHVTHSPAERLANEPTLRAAEQQRKEEEHPPAEVSEWDLRPMKRLERHQGRLLDEYLRREKERAALLEKLGPDGPDSDQANMAHTSSESFASGKVGAQTSKRRAGDALPRATMSRTSALEGMFTGADGLMQRCCEEVAAEWFACFQRGPEVQQEEMLVQWLRRRRFMKKYGVRWKYKVWRRQKMRKMREKRRRIREWHESAAREQQREAARREQEQYEAALGEREQHEAALREHQQRQTALAAQAVDRSARPAQTSPATVAGSSSISSVHARGSKREPQRVLASRTSYFLSQVYDATQSRKRSRTASAASPDEQPGEQTTKRLRTAAAMARSQQGLAAPSPTPSAEASRRSLDGTGEPAARRVSLAEIQALPERRRTPPPAPERPFDAHAFLNELLQEGRLSLEEKTFLKLYSFQKTMDELKGREPPAMHPMLWKKIERMAARGEILR